MKGNWSIVRQVLHRRFLRPSLRCSTTTLSISAPNSMLAKISTNCSPIHYNLSSTYPPSWRGLCSAAEGENGVVIVKSEQEFTNAISKAQDGSSPCIFYFTAAWCGPCRFISPVIVDLSKQYPHVTTYKVDIDEGGLSDTISKLNITAVPTLQFFKGGSKKGEVVGADVAKLKNLMEQLYK